MKKVLILILCCIMTLSVGVGCAGGGKQAATVQTTSSAASQTTAETKEIQPDLPDKKFDGYKITFVVRGSSFNEWESQDIYVEEQNGEPVNDAVYARNIYLEEKYNIKIAQSGVSDPGGTAKTAILAGSKDYDVIMENTSATATSLAANGYLVDLKTVPYLNLDQVWWDQRSVKQLSIADKLYFMTGDLSIMANDATWILMFNKDLVKDYSLESPYDLVNNGKWTFDKMYEMASKVAADLNGDGKMVYTDDQYGFATHDSSIEGFFFASGSHTVAKDKNDMPYIDMNSPRLTTVIEKANKLIADAKVVMNSSTLGLKPVEDLQPVFQSGRSLFYGEVMQCIIRLRAMEIDFGVIPFPKLDEKQEEYDHFIHTTAAMVSIPMTNTDLERTGIILEAMSAKSKYTLQKAYYKICLEGKFMRDEESKGMLDIILATRNYDIGYIYSWGNLFSAFQSCVKNGSTDFASSYASAETAAKTAMAKTIEVWTSVK